MSKVVHFSTVHPATDTRVFHKECVSLSEAGYDVTLFARCDVDARVKGVNVRRVDEYDGRVRRMFVGPIRLFRRLLAEKADVYHFHDPELLPVGIVLRLLGKTVVYDAHEWVRGDVGSKPYLPKAVATILGFIAWGVEQIGGLVVSHVVAATPFIASQFRPGRVTVIHNYPDLAELSNSDVVPWLNRQAMAVYIGGLNDERCGRELLDAADLLDKEGITLTIAGPTDDGLDPTTRTAVHYVGLIGRPQVAELLGRARCGVVLLRDLPNCRDAMPTKFFEYIAGGLPVVVSRSTLPIARLAIEFDCGVVVDETARVEIASAIGQLVRSDDAEDMGLRGRAAVAADLNWSSESVHLVNLYNRLLS